MLALLERGAEAPAGQRPDGTVRCRAGARLRAHRCWHEGIRIDRSRRVTELRVFVTLAPALLLAACFSDGDGEDGTSGAELYRACTDAELLRDVTEAEGRCVCRASVEMGGDLLARCLGADAYQLAVSSCDGADFRGYSTTCELRLAEWFSCRQLLFSVETCDEYEMVATDVAEDNLGGCREILAELESCVVRP